MTSKEKILSADIPSLTLVKYPDPRLKEVSTAIEEIDDSVRRLADRMFELMFAAKGVGLAGSQAGVTVRMFVSSPSYAEEDRHVYINPRILLADGAQEDDEGCLSFPGISCHVKRFNEATIEATDLEGQIFQETAVGLGARIYQHEMDHIDGRLLLDRMGSVARLACRRTIKQLEEDFAEIKR